jgi:hypothetical protein
MRRHTGHRRAKPIVLSLRRGSLRKEITVVPRPAGLDHWDAYASSSGLLLMLSFAMLILRRRPVRRSLCARGGRRIIHFGTWQLTARNTLSSDGNAPPEGATLGEILDKLNAIAEKLDN